SETASTIEEAFKRLGDVYDPIQKESQEGAIISKPRLIHIKDAQIYQSGASPLPSKKGVLWRGRLEAVDGFSLGKLSHRERAGQGDSHALPRLWNASCSGITPGLNDTLSCELINKETRYENSARLSGVPRHLLEFPPCALVRGQAIGLPTARPPDRLRHAARRLGASAGGYEHPAAQAVRHQMG